MWRIPRVVNTRYEWSNSLGLFSFACAYWRTSVLILTLVNISLPQNETDSRAVPPLLWW